MDKRIRRHIRRFDGNGALSKDGESVGTVRYQVDVWQNLIVIPSGEELPGTKHLEIDVDHGLDPVRLWQEGATFRLHFEDGRYLDGYLDGRRFIPGGQLMNADGTRAD